MNHIKTFSFYTVILITLILSNITILGLSQESLFPITITDDSDIKTIVNETPERLVSTAPSNTEIVFSLGLEKNLVGRSQFCNYPQGVENIESIGKMFPLNLEKIISLNPDLILAFGELNLLEDITKLRHLGFNVLVIQSESLQNTIQSIKLISLACGVPEKGTQMISDMQKRIEWVKNKVDKIPTDQRPKVFVGSNFDTIYSPGKGTLFDELITSAGGKNIVGHLKRWVKINPELVVQSEPDIILIPSGIMNPEEISKIKKDIINHPGWSRVPAIINHQIYTVNEDIFYRAGPRLVDGLELLYEIFN